MAFTRSRVRLPSGPPALPSGSNHLRVWENTLRCGDLADGHRFCHRRRRVQLHGRCVQVAFSDDVLAPIHRLGAVSDDHHGHLAGHAGPLQVPHGRPAEVARDATRIAGQAARRAPRPSQALDRLPSATEEQPRAEHPLPVKRLVTAPLLLDHLAQLVDFEIRDQCRLSSRAEFFEFCGSSHECMHGSGQWQVRHAVIEVADVIRCCPEAIGFLVPLRDRCSFGLGESRGRAPRVFMVRRPVSASASAPCGGTGCRRAGPPLKAGPAQAAVD